MKSKDILPESERQNIVNQIIVFDKLLEAIMACEKENEELKKENEELKRRIRCWLA